MKRGAGKNKGSEFERIIAKKISLWLSYGEKGDLLCRTEGSGGRYTQSKGNLGAAGDLMAVHPFAWAFCSAFVIECKHWKNLDVWAFLVKNGELWKALQKVRKEAETEKKQWMLIAKQNNRPILLITNASWSKPAPCASHSLFNSTADMYFFDDFLEKVFPEELLEGRDGK